MVSNGLEETRGDILLGCKILTFGCSAGDSTGCWLVGGADGSEKKSFTSVYWDGREDST